MTIYEIIKAAISVKQAAKHYGLNVNRNGMACCPFHNDRHPSLKLNEDYFFCFGCGAKGDVIDLVARLFDLSSYEAAQKLAADFGLDPKPPTAAAMVKPKRPYIRQFREDEMLCFRVLTDYLHLLEDWKVRYAPKTPEDALDDRFVEACQMHCYIEYGATAFPTCPQNYSGKVYDTRKYWSLPLCLVTTSYGRKDGRSDTPATALRISRPHRRTAVLPMDRQ